MRSFGRQIGLSEGSADSLIFQSIKMKKFIATFAALMTLVSVWAENPAAYVLYDKDGQKVDYSDMIQDLSWKDVVFLGEIHNCAIAHWMEKVIVADLYAIHGDRMMLGAEMFERDDQVLVTEYIGGLISQNRFYEESKLWKNYKTDYSPLIEFAKEHKLPFIATNVARRYANMVSKGGFEALEQVSEEGRQFIAPLPINYIPNEFVEKFFSRMPGNSSMSKAPSSNLPKAQAVKDATMAWSISQSLKGKMVHVNGSFHSRGHSGIITYLNVYRPGLKIGTVEVVHQKDVSSLDEKVKGNADYFICVPDNMATTY